MRDLLVIGTKEGVLVAHREEDAWKRASHSLTTRQVNSVSVQDGSVLAGTTEGIFRSDDLGRTWRSASEGLTEFHVRWLSHDPDGSGRVLAGTEPAAIFLSQDGGETWAERPEVARLRDENGWYLPYSPEAGCVRGFAFHGNRVYAAVEVGGLLCSDDAGETWHLVEGSNGILPRPPQGFIHPDVHSVTVHSSSPDLVFAPTGGGFYGSKDGGATWKQLYRSYCRAVWSDPADAEHLVLGPANSVDREGRVEETRDGGKTWRAASEGLEVPWPRHMVERFLHVNNELLAMLSNGELVAAPLPTLQWQQLLPDAGRVHAIARMRM